MQGENGRRQEWSIFEPKSAEYIGETGRQEAGIVDFRTEIGRIYMGETGRQEAEIVDF